LRVFLVNVLIEDLDSYIAVDYVIRSAVGNAYQNTGLLSHRDISYLQGALGVFGPCFEKPSDVLCDILWLYELFDIHSQSQFDFSHDSPPLFLFPTVAGLTPLHSKCCQVNGPDAD